MNDKWAELRERMAKLGIHEEDLVEKFILGSGSGGQKINKTSSCVYLQYTPSQIEIKCQKTRSRELNRLYARRELCARVEQILYQEKSTKQQEIEKIRRQKRKRSRRAQLKVLESKKFHSEKKSFRKRPNDI